MDEFIENIGENASFDMSFSSFARINYFLYILNNAKFQDDPIGWFKALDIVYMEIENSMNSKEAEEHKKLYSRVLQSYKEFLAYKNGFMQNRDHRKVFMPPKQIFEDLREWELKLKRNNFLKQILFKRDGDATKAMI